MKKTIASFLLLLALRVNAQVELYESFTAPFNPVAAGWNVQNLSSPVGTASWFQGNNSFSALVGGPTDYFAVNFNSTSGTGSNNTISNWLITPTLNLVNGGIVQFTTRTQLGSNFADRLQVYFSTAGNGTNVGTTAGTATNTAGTFTNIIEDINSAQLNSGYPDSWIVYTTTLSGISTPTVGRLAFRYYLTNGGASGSTGNFIGLDEFRYSQPCNFAPTYIAWGSSQLCSGNPVSLLVMGAATTAITSYTWNTGANTNTTTYVPQNSGTNFCYVLKQTTPGCVDLESASLNVSPSPTVAFVSTPSGNICSGSALTVTASGANTYTYLLNTFTSTTNPATLTAPNVTSATSISLVLQGTGSNNCVHSQTIPLLVNPNPTVIATGPTTAICVGSTATLSATGANTFSWSTNSSSNTVVLSPTITSTYSVTGTNTLTGCQSTQVLTLTVKVCSGLNEYRHPEAFSLYPNPGNGDLCIQTGSDLEQIRLLVTDLSGKIVYSAQAPLSQGQARLHLELANGVYTLSIQTPGAAQAHQKLIIQN